MIIATGLGGGGGDGGSSSSSLSVVDGMAQVRLKVGPTAVVANGSHAVAMVSQGLVVAQAGDGILLCAGCGNEDAAKPAGKLGSFLRHAMATPSLVSSGTTTHPPPTATASTGTPPQVPTMKGDVHIISRRGNAVVSAVGATTVIGSEVLITAASESGNGSVKLTVSKVEDGEYDSDDGTGGVVEVRGDGNVALTARSAVDDAASGGGQVVVTRVAGKEDGKGEGPGTGQGDVGDVPTRNRAAQLVVAGVTTTGDNTGNNRDGWLSIQATGAAVQTPVSGAGMRGGRGATLSFDGGDGEMDGFLRLASSTSSPRLVFGVRQSDRSTASATNGDAAATPAAAATDTTDASAAAPACVRDVLQIDGEGRALLGALGSDETAAAALHVRGQSRATRADEATTCNDGERAGLGQLDSTVMGQVVAPDAVAVFEGASDVSTMTNPTNPTNALGAAVQVVGAAGATSTAAAASLVLSAVAGGDSVSAPGWSLPGERRGVSHWVMSSSFDGGGTDEARSLFLQWAVIGKREGTRGRERMGSRVGRKRERKENRKGCRQ